MRIVLLGPPGAGKGSLAVALRESLKVGHISTGDMLREEMAKGSKLGLQIKALIDKGNLVSDALVTRLVEDRLSHGNGLDNGFILDGFPRTQPQAKELDKFLKHLGKPLDFTVSMETTLHLILIRLGGRRVCKKCGAIYHNTRKPSKVHNICDACGSPLYQRGDDNEEAICKRMDLYATRTQPIIDFYAASGRLKKIDGDEETADLRDDVVRIFNELQKSH